jgi:hypothetical protein
LRRLWTFANLPSIITFLMVCIILVQTVIIIKHFVLENRPYLYVDIVPSVDINRKNQYRLPS